MAQDRDLTVQILTSFSEVKASEWNSLVRGDFIFADHRFLLALEESGSIGPRTGWFPKIVVAREGGKLTGAIPLFEKTNSYGEYIFDWAWAGAAQQIGLDYYPKLVAAIPFTPATGPKFLLSPDSQKASRAREAILQRCHSEAEGLSSLHFLFSTPEEIEILRERSLLIRHSFQYHWRNRGWSTFDDFLAAFKSKRRQEIRRERNTIAASGLKISCLTGDQLNESHAQVMHAFYLSTLEKMGGHPYLTREFFVQVFTTMSESILFVLAQTADGQPVAGAVNFFGSKSLFGRYWGCVDEFKNLHFEVCYYQAIEWALARGYQLFEAGAQGEHKFNRGFTPHLTLSAHEINEPRLRSAISDFLEREKMSIDNLFAEYAEHDPFKKLD